MLIVPMLHQGGFERVCVETARLLESDFEVRIVIFDSRDIAYDITGLSVTDLQLGVREGLVGKAWNVIRRCLAVRKLKKEWGTGIAYSFGPTANLVNVCSGRTAKVWTGIRSYMDMGNPRKIRLFAGRSDRVLCCSRRITQEIRELQCGEKAVTLYNPVDPQQLRQRAGEETVQLPWQEPGKILVSMGREDDVKGFWHLIKSFSLLRKQRQEPVRLMIIGEGSFTEYRRLAEELGVAEDVFFTGLQKNPFPYLSKGDLYVLTSYYEGFPNALIEAMVFGIPAVATDCMTGPREILLKETDSETGRSCRPAAEAGVIWGDYGVLVPNMSPDKNLSAGEIALEEEQLARVMEALLDDPVLYADYQQAARERAAEFSGEAYVNRLKQWIQEDLNGEGCQGRQRIGV